MALPDSINYRLYRILFHIPELRLGSNRSWDRLNDYWRDILHEVEWEPFNREGISVEVIHEIGTAMIPVSDLFAKEVEHNWIQNKILPSGTSQTS